MASKVKQHILSKTYLKHFSLNGNGKGIYIINCQDKFRKGIQYKDSGDAIFWEEKFYNSDKFDSPTHLEDFFANDIEPLYNQVIADISKEKPITELPLKLALFQWIYYSKLRSPIWRGHYEKLLALGKPLNNHDSKIIQRKAKELHLRFFTDEPFYLVLLDKFMTVLFSKRWSILKRPDNNYWLTTDNPGFDVDLSKLSAATLPIAKPFWNVLNNNTLIYYPLSKDYCLEIKPYNSGEDISLNLTNTPIDFSTDPPFEHINYWTSCTYNKLIISTDRALLERII